MTKDGYGDLSHVLTEKYDKKKKCKHDWEMYTGLSESFEHCSQCGMKKSDHIDDTWFEEVGTVFFRDVLSDEQKAALIAGRRYGKSYMTEHMMHVMANQNAFGVSKKDLGEESNFAKQTNRLVKNYIKGIKL